MDKSKSDCSKVFTNLRKGWTNRDIGGYDSGRHYKYSSDPALYNQVDTY